MLGTENRVVDRYTTQTPDGVHFHILNVICMDDAVQNAWIPTYAYAKPKLMQYSVSLLMDCTCVHPTGDLTF